MSYVEDHSTPPPSSMALTEEDFSFAADLEQTISNEERQDLSEEDRSFSALMEHTTSNQEHRDPGDILFTPEEISYLERLLSNGAFDTVDDFSAEVPDLLEEIQFQEQVSSILAIQPTAIIADPSQPTDYDWTMAVPLGMKFRPTDVELINNYLKVEYVNGYVPRGIISSLDVYDYEPDQLPAFAVDHGDGKYYFFTRVKKIGKSNYCERIIKSKTGFWKATQSPKPIRDENETKIGYKLSLTYYNNKKKTPWLMNEYRLEFNSEHSSELVLAVIYYHQKKNAE